MRRKNDELGREQQRLRKKLDDLSTIIYEDDVEEVEDHDDDGLLKLSSSMTLDKKRSRK